MKINFLRVISLFILPNRYQVCVCVFFSQGRVRWLWWAKTGTLRTTLLIWCTWQLSHVVLDIFTFQNKFIYKETLAVTFILICTPIDIPFCSILGTLIGLPPHHWGVTISFPINTQIHTSTVIYNSFYPLSPHNILMTLHLTSSKKSPHWVCQSCSKSENRMRATEWIPLVQLQEKPEFLDSLLF